MKDIVNRIDELLEDTYIVRKVKKSTFIDQAFNNIKDAKKFANIVNGNIFTIKGNAITPFTR